MLLDICASFWKMHSSVMENVSNCIEIFKKWNMDPTGISGQLFSSNIIIISKLEMCFVWPSTVTIQHERWRCC